MSFRGYQDGGQGGGQGGGPAGFVDDPFARFVALDAALEPHRGMLGDIAAQRFTAIALVSCPGAPEQLATDTHAYADALGELLPWYTTASPGLCLLMAAILRRHGDRPDALVETSDRVGQTMRLLDMRWAPLPQLIAVHVMRVHVGGAPINDVLVGRMRDVWDAMRGHHPWLTGTDDWPSCALLSTRPGQPNELADRAHLIYEALREHAGGRRGQALQTASNLLAVADVPPRELAERYAALRAGFEAAGCSIAYGQYADVACLCLIPRAIASVVETVVATHEQVRELLRWHEAYYRFMCATNLTLVHALGRDAEYASLLDVKQLYDLMQIIAQRG